MKSQDLLSLLKRPLGPETMLDHLVRNMLAGDPRLFETRVEAIVNLYMLPGNGYYWKGGVIEGIFPKKSKAEVSSLFLSGFHAGTAEYARRQFQLDSLDLLSVETSMLQVKRICPLSLVRDFDQSEALAFNVPEGAEESFRQGAVEALGVCAAVLRTPAVKGELRGAKGVYRLVQAELARMSQCEDFQRQAKSVLNAAGRG